MNFKEYKIAAKYAFEINAGYSANLYGLTKCPYRKDEGKRGAWQYGWNLAQSHVEGK